MKRKMKLLTFGVALIIVLLAIAPVILQTVVNKNSQVNSVRVACIGDSITGGTEYTIDLWKLLGPNYVVGNFGIGGATVSFNSDSSYGNQSAIQVAKQFEPNIVIIMLGTNDANTDLNQSNTSFIDNYAKFVGQFQGLASKPKIWIVKPPPIFNNTAGLSPEYLSQNVIPSIEQVANKTKTSIIDVYSRLAGHPDYFIDGVHPNIEGSHAIATTIYNALVLQDNVR
jgi:lysophospholipase L1-like esterase